MNEIVLWAQRVAPNAWVQPVKLSPFQAYNTERRNLFYERFGLEFDYTDSSKSAGESKPIIVRELQPVNSWSKNITEHDVRDYVATLFQSEIDCRRLDKALQELIAERLAAQKQPLRWAARQYIDRYRYRLWFATGLACCAAVAGLWKTGVPFMPK